MTAIDAAGLAYAPYSKYYVGSALKAKSGKIYTGCNIQNNGIMSICAERVAFTKAISEGEKEFEYIVIVGGSNKDSIESCIPCGYCRQFINEFVNSDFKIFNTSSIVYSSRSVRLIKSAREMFNTFFAVSQPIALS